MILGCNSASRLILSILRIYLGGGFCMAGAYFWKGMDVNLTSTPRLLAALANVIIRFHGH